ncbi:MAG: hypothetical protein WBC04_04395 [Candidatus Acidiferrales bacterium]
MKPVRRIGAGVLLLLGAIAPTCAQQEQHEQDAKPPKQEQQAKPEKQQQQATPARQEQQAKGQQDQQQKQQQQQAKSARQEQQQQAKGQQEQQQKQQQQQAKPARQEQQQQANGQQDQQGQQQRQQRANRPSQQEQHGQQGEQQAAWQEHRAHSWQSEHRTWQQRGGYNGYRIPDDRYRGDFGRDHGFRIYGLPELVVGGYPRFQYGGFWFSLVDPWPEAWSDNWYENDDVYIAYADDGYYLYDRRHPDVGISVSVYAN